MPSSVRKVTATAVQALKALKGMLTQRNCPDLLVIGAADQLVRVADALDASVAHLDASSVLAIRDQARVAIVAAESIPLRGAAPGMDEIKDDVGRLICERQLPTVFRCLVLAAVIVGVEDGLRSLLIADAQPIDLSRLSSVKERSSAARSSQAFPAPGTDPAADTAIAQPAADLLDRLSPAITPVTTPASGRVEIKQDTERI